jgi:hypothetical protein
MAPASTSTPVEQIRRANILGDQRRLGQWLHCGSRHG